MSRAICPKCGKTDVSWIRDDADCAQYICLECKQGFCYPPKTVFDHITESIETLAEKLVCMSYIKKKLPLTDIRGRLIGYKSVLRQVWISSVAEEIYSKKSEALAATMEELKKEWKG